jgi:MoxR-like ATPase
VLVGKVFVDPALISWVVALATATRRPAEHGLPQIAPYVAYGASPRGPISVIAAARALAVLRGRDYVVPADVEAVVRDAFRHRLVLSYQALAEGVTADGVLDAALEAIKPPRIDLDRTAAAVG